jgi:hypothetical protein
LYTAANPFRMYIGTGEYMKNFADSAASLVFRESDSA